MEQLFAVEHLQSFPPQLVARNATQLVSIVEAERHYPSVLLAATDQLVRIGPLGVSEVPRLLRVAKQDRPDWLLYRVEYVLTAIGNFSPEVVNVINDIRGMRGYQKMHPNTHLHPMIGTHYIDSIHLSDRIHANVGSSELK